MKTIHSVQELLADFFFAHDVTHVFGVPGYANSLVFHAAKASGALPVLARHEANAAWMAYGYAQNSKTFGVCTGTSGPGSTNLITGVTAAFMNSVPLLVVTGQVESEKFGRGGFQELTGKGARNPSVLKLFAPVTLFNTQPQSAEELKWALHEASRWLLSGRRGPVHINIPVDVLRSTCEPLSPSRFTPKRESPLPPEGGLVSQAATLLQKARAPLVLVGQGSREAASQIESFLNKSKLPYCSTIQAKGAVLAQSAPNLGLCGVAGSDRCNAYVSTQCDVLLVLGSSLGEFTTNGFAPSFFGNKKIIRVDFDHRELNKSPCAQLCILSEVSAFIAALDHCWPDSARAEPGAIALQSIEAVSPMRSAGTSSGDDEVIKPFQVISLLEEAVTNREAVIYADSGNNAVWAIHYLNIKRGQKFFVDINSGCMGSGVVASIGAQFALKTKKVIAICGDGGFTMNGMDVATAAEHGLDVLWIVFNDSKLGMVAQGDTAKYGSAVATDFEFSNIHLLARALGAESERVRTVSEFKKALLRALESKTFVLDVTFDASCLPSVYGRVKALEQAP